MTSFPRRVPRAPIRVNFTYRNIVIGVGTASPIVFGMNLFLFTLIPITALPIFNWMVLLRVNDEHHVLCVGCFGEYMGWWKIMDDPSVMNAPADLLMKTIKEDER